eukprot:tig00020904_g15170.t1
MTAGPPETLAELRKVFRSGKTRPLAWRKAQLQALKKLMSENRDAICAAVKKDLGRAELSTQGADVWQVKEEADWFIDNLASLAKDESVSTPAAFFPTSSFVRREPLGVVLIIGPWNYPFLLLMQPFASAIAAGNCVVLKPSEVVETCAALIAELVPKYMDAECFRVVSGGPAASRALCSLPFDHIFFTGGTAIGREVYKAAAENLVPVTLELGGKSPALVDETADLRVACRRIAWGRFAMNTGQICIAPDYVLVHASRRDALVEGIKAAVVAMFGEDPKASNDYGRIVTGRHLARLRGLIDDPAAKVEHGGQHDEAARYLAPTILALPDTRAAAGAKCMQEEIFGPALPVIPYQTLDEAIDFINDRPKPLAAYVFTSSKANQERFLRETSSGGVDVNDCMMHVSNPNLPFGGVGPSGIGQYHRKYGFDAFSNRKSVASCSTLVDPDVRYPPIVGFKAKLYNWLYS